MFEVPAGGRRYRALELLVKQKVWQRLNPCLASFARAGLRRMIPLAENDERVGLHPLDQLRAFQTLPRRMV